MQHDIIEKVLEKLNCMMKPENQDVLLFLGNAQVHPENLMRKHSNIKIACLLKNTTYKLQSKISEQVITSLDCEDFKRS